MVSPTEMVSPGSNGQPPREGQPRSNAQPRRDGQPYAHAHVLKVQSSFDRPRSEVKGEGQPFCRPTKTRTGLD